MLKKLTLMLVVAMLSACSSQPIKESWQDPSATLPVNFSKTLLVAIMDTPANRRIAEDQLKQQLPAIHAEVSYSIIEDHQLSQLAEIKETLVNQGYQHSLLLRLVSSATEVVQRPSMGISAGRGFGGRRGTAMHFSSGTLDSQEKVLFELSLYDLNTDQLIWSGNGEVSNPSSMAETITSLSNGMITRWNNMGLLAQ